MKTATLQLKIRESNCRAIRRSEFIEFTSRSAKPDREFSNQLRADRGRVP